MIELWPHQVEGSNYLTQNGSGFLLWEPRCGKTFATIDSIKDEEHILIVCPNSAKLVWKADFEAYCGRSVEYNKGKNFDKGSKLVAINYESLKSSKPFDSHWDVVVFDEIHRLSNWSSGLAQYLTEATLPRRRIGLTGTLCPEGYQQAIFPFEAIFGKWFWHEKDAEGIPAWSHEAMANWTYNERKFKLETAEHHKKRCAAWIEINSSRLTQKQAGICQAKSWKTIMSPPGECQRLYYEAMALETPAERFQAVWQAGSGIQGGKISVKVPKFDAVVDATEFSVTDGIPVVVVARHTASLDYLEKQMRGRKIKFARIDGKDAGVEYRGKAVADLNAGRISAILAQVETIKEALNLSKAGLLMYAENSWSGTTRIQSEERLTCKGKESEVKIWDFCTRFADGESMDLKISGIVRLKKDFNFNLLSI